MSSVPTTADRLLPSAAGSPLAVILFAGMAEIVGARRLEMPWDGGTVADLRRELAAAEQSAAGRQTISDSEQVSRPAGQQASRPATQQASQ